MKAILLGNGSRSGVTETVSMLQPEIEKLLDIVAVDFTGQIDMSECGAEIAIVFGGDGSVLRAIHQLGARQIPVLAVNVGTLAFLSSLSPDELLGFLKSDNFRRLSVRKQILLECTIWRQQETASAEEDPLGEEEAAPREFQLAKKLVVNDVTVQGGPPFEILHIDLSVDGAKVTTCHGDGLIISTPTGSTGHNLSTGGPILRRDLNVVVISPISPHALSYRPVVDSANRIYEIRVLNREVFVVIDGDSSLTLRPGDRLEVKKAAVAAKMVRIPGRNYYRTLREKLGWSVGTEFYGGGSK